MKLTENIEVIDLAECRDEMRECFREAAQQPIPLKHSKDVYYLDSADSAPQLISNFPEQLEVAGHRIAADEVSRELAVIVDGVAGGPDFTMRRLTKQSKRLLGGFVLGEIERRPTGITAQRIIGRKT